MKGRPRPLRIALVAGEASGDLLGAGLIRELHQRLPNAVFAGIGGPAMRAAGLDAWHDAAELAVMGLAEVLRHLPRLLRLRQRLAARLLEWKPDVLVGIDAPDFNLGLERRLKEQGIPTAHYVSPSVWAWREHRAARIGASAKRVLCLFPMEPPIYARHGVDARFVGHPLADRFPLHPDRAAARAALGLSPTVPVLAVLPGSRLSETQRLTDIFLATARQVAAAVEGLQIVIPAADAACRAVIAKRIATLSGSSQVHLLDGQSHPAMIASDVVLLASGTAALEALLAKRPMVVGYRIAPLTYALVRRLGLMKIDRYSLPNVLAGEALVPECMQHECTAERLSAALLPLFCSTGQTRLLERFEAIHRQLRQNANRQAADAVFELLTASAAAPRENTP